MAKEILPDGSVLVGPKADEYRRAQAKAQKAAKAKLVEAKKAGDAAAAAELAATKATPGLSSAAAASAAVLDEIRSGKHGYTFYRITTVDGLKFSGVHSRSGTLDEFELHPSLLKKSGKAAIDISEGVMVAVRLSKRYFQGYVNGCRVDDPTASSINYICAIIPPEMVSA
jgi:hypothetical protein